MTLYIPAGRHRRSKQRNASGLAQWGSRGGVCLVLALMFVVCGLWFAVYGLWFVVYGLWFVVCGLWFVMVCGLQFVGSGLLLVVGGFRLGGFEFDVWTVRTACLLLSEYQTPHAPASIHTGGLPATACIAPTKTITHFRCR